MGFTISALKVKVMNLNRDEKHATQKDKAWLKSEYFYILTKIIIICWK